MKVLFYKGPGLIDSLMRISGPYSHCEVEFSTGIAFSSSWRDGGVRFKDLRQSRHYAEHWDVLVFNCCDDDVIQWAASEVGAKYDWRGVVSTCVGLPIESDEKWFCSEICSVVCEKLGIYKGSKLITPSELYRRLS
jgi:uncharacterized protein YycO